MPAASPTLPAERPTVAVLPFANLGGDPAQQFFSDGITQDIITELSRFRSLYVIAAHSAFSQRASAGQPTQAANQLGATYVLQGSIRRAGDRVRALVDLVDAATGENVWSERFDGDLRDIFAIQDEIVGRIAASLHARLEAQEADRASRKPPQDLEAYDYVLKGFLANQRYTHDDNALARRMFEKALALAPDYPRAIAGLASAYLYGWFLTERREGLDRAFELARRALQLDPADAWCHYILGRIHLHLRNFALAEHFYARSLELNPNDADVLASRGLMHAYLGEPDAAVADVEAAMRLNPYHPDWYYENLGFAHLVAKRYEAAVATLRRVDRPPSWILAYLAAALARLGRLEEAASAVARALALEPGETVARIATSDAFESPADRHHLAESLRLAGFPD